MYLGLWGSLYQNTVAHSTMSGPRAISTWSSTFSLTERSWAQRYFVLKPYGGPGFGPGDSSDWPIAS